MTREFKRIAMELNVAVVHLAQLNRDASDDGKRPVAENLRESGAVEQDAEDRPKDDRSDECGGTGDGRSERSEEVHKRGSV
jgi:hypothetical protein